MNRIATNTRKTLLKIQLHIYNYNAFILSIPENILYRLTLIVIYQPTHLTFGQVCSLVTIVGHSISQHSPSLRQRCQLSVKKRSKEERQCSSASSEPIHFCFWLFFSILMRVARFSNGAEQNNWKKNPWVISPLNSTRSQAMVAPVKCISHCRINARVNEWMNELCGWLHLNFTVQVQYLHSGRNTRAFVWHVVCFICISAFSLMCSSGDFHWQIRAKLYDICIQVD